MPYIRLLWRFTILQGVSQGGRRLVSSCVPSREAYNWRIDNLFVGPSEMTFSSTKCGKLPYVMTYDVIWANQKTQSSVFRLLRAHAMFDVLSNVLSRICLSIGRQFKRSVDTIIGVCLFQRLVFDSLSTDTDHDVADPHGKAHLHLSHPAWPQHVHEKVRTWRMRTRHTTRARVKMHKMRARWG